MAKERYDLAPLKDLKIVQQRLRESLNSSRMHKSSDRDSKERSGTKHPLSVNERRFPSPQRSGRLKPKTRENKWNGQFHILESQDNNERYFEFREYFGTFNLRRSSDPMQRISEAYSRLKKGVLSPIKKTNHKVLLRSYPKSPKIKRKEQHWNKSTIPSSFLNEFTHAKKREYFNKTTIM